MRRVSVHTPSITPRESHSFKLYLKEVAKYDVLTPAEEVRLFELKKHGDASAREKLIQHNMRYVISVAKKYYHYSQQEKTYEFSDIVEQGNIGLVMAVDKFDTTTGFKFISFATWWIQSHILDFVSKTHTVHIPNGRYWMLARCYKALHKREVIENRLLEFEDVIFKMDLPDIDMERLYKINFWLDKRNIVKLDDLIPDKCSYFDNEFFSQDDERLDYSYMDNIKDDSEFTQPDYTMMHESLQINIGRMLETLSYREEETIVLYYGLYDSKVHTATELSEKFSLNVPRLESLRAKAVRRLRHSSRNSILGNPFGRWHYKYEPKSFIGVLKEKSCEYKEQKKKRKEKISMQDFKMLVTLYCMNCGNEFKDGKEKILKEGFCCHRCGSDELEVAN